VRELARARATQQRHTASESQHVHELALALRRCGGAGSPLLPPLPPAPLLLDVVTAAAATRRVRRQRDPNATLQPTSGCRSLIVPPS